MSAGIHDAARFGPQVMERLDELARISSERGALTRAYLTHEHRAAGELIARWMEQAGMRARYDAAGNVVGRYEGREPGAPAVMVGSHMDTVRDAGRYDGMLGVVSAIACVGALHEAGARPPLALEVIAFADEEGVRFGATLIGSRAVAGTLDVDLLARTDADGVSVAEALRDFGLDPDAIGEAARRPDEIAAFLELHIEQGPVLERESLPVGVVSAIAGATRFEVTVRGQGGHAGTVPMEARRDAAAAAAEAVLCVERRCAGVPGLVGTVGQLAVPAGSANKIAERAHFSIDVRSGKDAARAGAVADILEELQRIGARRDVEVVPTKTHEAAAVQCAPALVERMEAVIEGLGLTPRRLMSGAGHDAMAMAALADVGMLFVRCGRGGISHHPDETITLEDAGTGTAVLLEVVRAVADDDSIDTAPRR